MESTWKAALGAFSLVRDISQMQRKEKCLHETDERATRVQGERELVPKIQNRRCVLCFLPQPRKSI